MSERRPEERDGDGASVESRDVRRRRYEAPRITKRRPVAKATLFSGSGPDSGGVVSA